jgi:hypothetical protein
MSAETPNTMVSASEVAPCRAVHVACDVALRRAIAAVLHEQRSDELRSRTEPDRAQPVKSPVRPVRRHVVARAHLQQVMRVPNSSRPVVRSAAGPRQRAARRRRSASRASRTACRAGTIRIPDPTTPLASRRSIALSVDQRGGCRQDEQGVGDVGRDLAQEVTEIEDRMPQRVVTAFVYRECSRARASRARRRARCTTVPAANRAHRSRRSSRPAHACRQSRPHVSADPAVIRDERTRGHWRRYFRRNASNTSPEQSAASTRGQQMLPAIHGTPPHMHEQA